MTRMRICTEGLREFSVPSSDEFVGVESKIWKMTIFGHDTRLNITSDCSSSLEEITKHFKHLFVLGNTCFLHFKYIFIKPELDLAFSALESLVDCMGVRVLLFFNII